MSVLTSTTVMCRHDEKIEITSHITSHTRDSKLQLYNYWWRCMAKFVKGDFRSGWKCPRTPEFDTIDCQISSASLK